MCLSVSRNNKITKVWTKNPLEKSFQFVTQNSLKLTCEHIKLENFSGGKPPDPRSIGEGEGEAARGGKGEKGRGGGKRRGGEGEGRGGGGEGRGGGKGREGRFGQWKKP
jgi:hypothetical protein